jgi:type I restriction enzyme S subunit
MLTVGDVCEFKYGSALPERSREAGKYAVYGSNGQVGTHSAAITYGPTVIVGRKGSIGKISYSPAACWPIDTAYYIDGKSSPHDLRWLAYALESLGLDKLNKATGVPGLNRNDAYQKRLYVPPLDEQRRIAAILDQADALRRKRREALQRASALQGAVFQDMFGPARHQSSWPTKELREVVRGGTIITYGMVQAGDEFEGGVPYIRTGDIIGGEIIAHQLRRADPAIAAKFDRARVEAGDIVMSIRATVGTTAMVQPELDGANLTQGTAKIAPGPLTDGPYLLAYLRSGPAQRWIAKQVKGATFREITLSRLREMPVVVPPLELQKRFASRAKKLADIEAIQRDHLGHLDALFASLQHRAFRGEL